MLKPAAGLLTIALSIAAIATPTYGADTFQSNGSSVFVMTNDNSKNEVLTYLRSYNGQYELRARTATDGRGSGGRTDPLQSQGSLTLSGDHELLFAVNSASGTVSSFHLGEGVPFFVGKESSGGAFPIAVTEHNHTQ